MSHWPISAKVRVPIRHERDTATARRDDRKGALVKATHGRVYVLDLVGERAVIVPASRRDVARPR